MKEHTVYEVEGVGLILGLHLLNGLSCWLTNPTVMGTDSQAVIKALKNQHSHLGHYLLDAIHLSAKCLHVKQDSLINSNERHQTLADGHLWKGKNKGIVNLQLHWVPGYCDFGPNERANEEAKQGPPAILDSSLDYFARNYHSASLHYVKRIKKS